MLAIKIAIRSLIDLNTVSVGRQRQKRAGRGIKLKSANICKLPFFCIK